MGAAARARVEAEFDLERMLERYVQVLEDADAAYRSRRRR
jgi:hypothetical protein